MRTGAGHGQIRALCHSSLLGSLCTPLRTPPPISVGSFVPQLDVTRPAAEGILPPPHPSGDQLEVMQGAPSIPSSPSPDGSRVGVVRDRHVLGNMWGTVIGWHVPVPGSTWGAEVWAAPPRDGMVGAPQTLASMGLLFPLPMEPLWARVAGVSAALAPQLCQQGKPSAEPATQYNNQLCKPWVIFWGEITNCGMIFARQMAC